MPVNPLLPGRSPETYQFRRLSTALTDLNTESIRYQDMASSGVKIAVGSDDPGGAIKAGLMQRSIERNEALQEQLAVADSHAAATDVGLAAFADAAVTARGLLQTGIGSQSGPSEKLALAEEAAALRQSIILEGNRTFRDRALFAGTDPTETPFVDLALVPEAASSLLMPATLGYQRAADMLLLGEAMGAEEGHAAGLINGIVPEGELLDTALAKAAQLAKKPPAALRMAKSLMKAPL
ncbi:MAG: enoyl-CoA hydratase-related protein, partial [Planctomycetota bacterium]